MASLTFLISYQVILAFFVSLILLLIIRRASTGRGHVTLPRRWPVVGMASALAANLHWFHDWVVEVAKLCNGNFQFYGPWFSSMDMFVTTDPANIRHILNIAFDNYPKGREFSEIFDIVGEGIIAVDGELWRTQRRVTQALVTQPCFRSFVAASTAKKLETCLVPLVTGVAERGETIDLQDLFSRLTLDLSCQWILGVDTSCLDPELPDVPFASAVDTAMQAIFFRHVLPSRCWKMLRRLGLSYEGKLAQARRVIDDFVYNAIKTKRLEAFKEETANDILSSLMIDPPENVPISSPEKLLRDTAVTLMIAGRDTINIAMTWFFWLMIENPRVEQKIIEELESCLTYSDEGGNLLYLNAAIYEALRLYPPVPMEHKVALTPETLPSGHDVSPRNKIVIMTYAMARMESVWGKDCAEFKPERWITEQGKLKNEPSYKFFTFNSGPRTCLGKLTSLMQIRMVAAALLPLFKFEVVENHVVEKSHLSIVLRMKNGLKVRVKKRRNSTN